MFRIGKSGKSEEWAARFERFEGSGLTVSRWCDAEGVSESSFYYWKKKLRDSALSAENDDARPRDNSRSGQQQRREASPPSQHRGSFQAVRISSPGGELVREEAAIQHQTIQQPATTIHVGNEVRIELGADLQVVEVVVQQVLEACSDSLRRVPLVGGQTGVASSTGAQRC